MIKPYLRRANYYETDRMGIVHHSNYIRYFEEARIEAMYSIECDILKMEEEGLIIPNVDAYARYKKMIKFHDLMEIYIKLTDFNGVKMQFDYEIRFAETKELAATGRTTHCFVNENHRPISIKKTHPEIYNKLMQFLEKDDTND